MAEALVRLRAAGDSFACCLALRARFDRIFRPRAGFVNLDRLLARVHATKVELLMVLERPDTPLHTKGSGNDIRGQAMRRNISAGTRGTRGGIAAIPSSVSPSPAQRSVWHSGTISAIASVSRANLPLSLLGLVRCRGQPA
jgi:hypothetical protein